MIDPDLLRSINSGRCFAFVGAGPSIELQYPSWELLAEDMCRHVLNTVPSADAPSYKRFLSEKNYPALFRQAEVDLKSRAALISAVKDLLKPRGASPAHPVYEYLSKWPFACYLTTNFDNELSTALAAQGQHYQIRHNSVADLSVLRDGVSHLIVKIHSDLEHATEAVITSVDYDRILTAPAGEHIRQKLRQVFEMFDVFIIGHSMSDADLRLILQTAKHTASPLRPIHMVSANATIGQIREFQEQYNIRLSTYFDGDGSHHKLRHMFTVADRFICPRGPIVISATAVSDEEVDAASSLLLFQRLRTMGDATPATTTLDSLLLFSLACSLTPLSREELTRRPTVAAFAGSVQGSRAIDEGLLRLIATGLVQPQDQALTVSPKGKVKVDEVAAQRKLEEEQAFGQFELDLKNRLKEVTGVDCGIAKKALRNALVGAFRSRGIAMANVIMADQSLSAEELSDIFRELSKHAASMPSDLLRAAFLESAHTFLVDPTGPQKAYLASVSQGFFLYHMAGMDPACTKTRRGLFANTCWFIDSSVMLPLLAVGCHNHQYAVDLFEKLKSADAAIFTTVDLLKEVGTHLDWAINFMSKHSIGSADFLAAAMVKEEFKQNLFIDGYVRESAGGCTGTFGDYLASVAPSGVPEEALSKACKKYGMTVVRAPDVDGFRQEDWGDIEEIKSQLTDHRKHRGTFRGESQVQAEAEVLLLIRRIRQGKYKLAPGMEASCRVYFVSQSRALDVVSQEDRIVTWTPEAVYRYVSSLAGMEIRADLLQECMLHEYFYAGVSFVDKSRYLKFFGPSIRQSKISYREQIDGYLQQTEQLHRRSEYDAAFETTPDLAKPFFVTQLGWELARKTSEKAANTEKRAERDVAIAATHAREAEKRARESESIAVAERKARIAAEQRAARLRNLGDPKHVRKRAKQAKKRHRKK